MISPRGGVHVTVPFKWKNLVQRFVIYENRIIAFVGQLLAVDNDLRQTCVRAAGLSKAARIDERQMTVVYAVGERPAEGIVSRETR